MTTREEKIVKYLAWWNRAVIRTDGLSGAERCANKIIASKDVYKKVEFATGVPWYFVGMLHSMESNFDFSTWLANGDPVSGPTTHVPEGLESDGTWHNAAIVSLRHMEYDKEKDWSLGNVLYLATAYNGFGYDSRGRWCLERHGVVWTDWCRCDA